MKVPIHREGFPFIALFAGINLLAFLMAPLAGWLLLPLTIWCIAFFRDPERNTPTTPGLIISPADGKLLPIVEAPPPPELGLGEAPRLRLSIFMNVFNVHVNRSPLSGTVTGLAYRPGRFFNASFDKASIHNERMAIRLRPAGAADPGNDLVVVQIAGLVARRIVCDLAQGQQVQRGTRFGMIRFGSRLDVYLPAGARIVAAPGMKTVAGETVLAEMAP
jgi:phosphatidylserine decarboxylase